MGKVYEGIGYHIVISDGTFKIEFPIESLIDGFNLNPNNYDESVIKEDFKHDFLDYVAKALIDSSSAEIGDSLVIEMLDSVFNELLEGAEDFVDYSDDM